MKRLLTYGAAIASFVLVLTGCEWHEHAAVEGRDHGVRYDESGRVGDRDREGRREGVREDRESDHERHESIDIHRDRD